MRLAHIWGMHTAAPDLASIRARLAELTSRADARRARDAAACQELAPPTFDAPVRETGGAAWKATHARDWLAEAHEDLARIDATPRVHRTRPEVAPEYATEDGDEVEAEASAKNPTAPAADAKESAAPPAESAETQEPPRPQERPLALRRVVRHPPAVARATWQERWARIEANVLQAKFAPSPPELDPSAWVLARAGPDPPA